MQAITMTLLRRTVMDLADRAGYIVVPKWRLENWHVASFMQRLLSFLRVDLVLDVGANTGQFYDLLRNHVGYRGNVVFFEPIPELAAKLRARAISEPGWRIEEQALSAMSEDKTFNIMADSQFSSFRMPTTVETARFSLENEIKSRLRMKTSTLKEWLPILRRDYDAKSVYLKLDTQGFDLDVLRGAGDELDSVSGLQTEATVTGVYEGAPRYHEVIGFLEGAGFFLSGMHPNNSAQFPRLMEFDCFMINSSRCSTDSHAPQAEPDRA